jgi:DNA mismatch repair protein MutS
LERIGAFLSQAQIAHLAMAVNQGKALSVPDMSWLLKWLLQKDASHELEHFWHALFEYEATWSIAKGIKARGFVFPVFTGEALLLEQFYHPMLKNPVRNDFSTRNNVMLLTGPNMAGKSTVLKSITICVLLAHLGLAVPAQRCEVPFYDDFLISINVTDDIQNGYSHFMQEIMNLKTIMQQAVSGKKCFAVFDELFSGTNIDDAIEITCSTVRGLSQQSGSLFMISTHLYQLDELLPPNSFEACQLEAMIEDGMPRHTYVLKRGWSRLKFGKLLFEKEGLNKLLNGIAGS